MAIFWDNSILLLGAILLGLIFGSFINALVFRYKTGEGMGGRSHCMNCGHTLGALDLVPVFSYLFLRGRCRYCGHQISWQYPLVEMVGALLSLGVCLVSHDPFQFTISFVLWMTLLFAVVYDLRHQLLPLEALCIIGLCGLALNFFSCVDGGCQITTPTLLAVLSGPLAAAPLLLISLITRERGMGWGDGLLELGLGWMLGWTGGYSALFIGVWSGAIVGLLLIAWSRHHARKRLTVPDDGMAKEGIGITMKSRVPFGPFLALGAAAVYFLHVDFLAKLLW